MADAPYTLALLFGFDTTRGPDGAKLLAQVTRAVKEVATLKHVAAHGIPEAQWGAVAEQAVRLVRQTLDISLGTILARAWNSYAPLRAYADASKYPPDQ